MSVSDVSNTTNHADGFKDNLMVNWENVPNHDAYKNLLLGNGFSIGISRNFNYWNLLEEAKSRAQDGRNEIYPDTFRLFERLQTTNFEEILKVYHHAYLVHNYNIPAIETAYRKLQEGLFSTIRDIHVQKNDTPTGLVFEELRKFRKVFTTNYDLIPYWSFFDNGLGALKDFFWGADHKTTFDKNDIEVFAGNYTQLFYLHGALHLEVTESGKVQKRSLQGTLNEEIRMLLTSFSARNGLYPLFITEGKSEQKIRKIGSNDYLSFCYNQLKKIDGKLIIFGHSLSEEFDNHIVEALKNNSNISEIAISIYPDQSIPNINEMEARLTRQLDGRLIHFFNSKTHPLSM